MRCQAMRQVADIDSSVWIVCDLEPDHASEWHEDKFNKIRWMGNGLMPVPATPVTTPPKLYRYQNVEWDKPRIVPMLARDEVMVG